MTLKTKLLVADYSIAGTVLEHADEICNLDVILDTNLTFVSHVNQVVVKANRALGVFDKALPESHCGKTSKLVIRPDIMFSLWFTLDLEYCSVIGNGLSVCCTR